MTSIWQSQIFPHSRKSVSSFKEVHRACYIKLSSATVNYSKSKYSVELLLSRYLCNCLSYVHLTLYTHLICHFFSYGLNAEVPMLIRPTILEIFAWNWLHRVFGFTVDIIKKFHPPWISEKLHFSQRMIASLLAPAEVIVTVTVSFIVIDLSL